MNSYSKNKFLASRRNNFQNNISETSLLVNNSKNKNIDHNVKYLNVTGKNRFLGRMSVIFKITTTKTIDEITSPAKHNSCRL